MSSLTLMFILWLQESEQNICTDLKSFTMFNNIYKPVGSRINNSIAGGLLHCVDKCQAFKLCQAFEFNIKGANCALYSNYESTTYRDEDIVVSAIKDWPGTPKTEEREKKSTKIWKGYDCFLLFGKRSEDFYKGKVNVTRSGYTCQRWDSHAINHHYENGDRDEHFSNTEETMDTVANYCRMPTSDSTRAPWCFTADHSKRWDFCSVTKC